MRRKIQDNSIAIPRYRQEPRLRVEYDRVTNHAEAVEQHKCGCQRRVAAQLDLGCRREPADAVVLAVRHEERRLGQVVLCRDRLHQAIGQPGLERADRRRVALERPLRKSIDLVDVDLHAGTASKCRPDFVTLWTISRDLSV